MNILSKTYFGLKTFLLRHEKIITRLIQLFLCIIVILRIITTWKSAGFVDTRYFVETAKLILKGISPYHPDTNPTEYKYPLQAPSMSLMSMPFSYFPEIIQNFLFFMGGLLSFIMFVVLVFHYYGYHVQDYIKARWRNLPIWLIITSLCISAPLLLMLRHGQNSSIAVLFLFAALFYPARDKGIGPICLGLAAATKYSLLTMQAPILILQRRWRVIFFSFLLFIVMVLSVGFWLDGIVPAFRDYVMLVVADAVKGANSYSNTVQFGFIHIGFFRCNLVNQLMKLLLLILYLITLFRLGLQHKGQSELFRFPNHLSAIEWGAFTALTVTISYHRYYDGVIFLPFIGVILADSIYEIQKDGLSRYAAFKTICLMSILLFWATPFKLVFVVETWLGKILQIGRTVFVYSNNDTMFPLTKLVMLGTTWILLVLANWELSSRNTKKSGLDLCSARHE